MSDMTPEERLRLTISAASLTAKGAEMERLRKAALQVVGAVEFTKSGEALMTRNAPRLYDAITGLRVALTPKAEETPE